MIVLAIAGLVLAIVFIAVPALQRNSRDTQRKGDISALQSSIATYVGNNNGRIPDSAADLVGAVSSIDFSFYNVTPVAWPTAAAAENTIYTAQYATGAPGAAASGSAEAEDYVLYVEGAECFGGANPKTTARNCTSIDRHRYGITSIRSFS